MGDQQQGPQHLFSKPGRVFARYVEATLFASLPLRRVSELNGWKGSERKKMWAQLMVGSCGDENAGWAWLLPSHHLLTRSRLNYLFSPTLFCFSLHPRPHRGVAPEDRLAYFKLLHFVTLSTSLTKRTGFLKVGSWHMCIQCSIPRMP